VVHIRNGCLPPVFDEAERTAVRAGMGILPEAVVATMIGVLRLERATTCCCAAAGRWTGWCSHRRGRSEMRSVRRLAAALPPGRVVLAGFREDVARLLAASDLVVQPSRFDALPTTLIHALAAGIPAVASEVGGIPEIVAPGTGVLVPPGDPDRLATAIRSLAGDPDARRWMGKAARERFDQEFDGVRWARRLVSLYRSLPD
jgi:glycosyltransferase involved in cell wall biosynthesis